MAADGSIIVKAEVDNKKALADLARLEKKIDGLNTKITQAQDARFPLAERAQELSVLLDAAKAKLDEMQNAASGTYTTDQLAQQSETVRALQAEYDRVQRQVEAYDRTIAKSTTDLEAAQAQAGELSAQISTLPDASEKAAAGMGKLEKRLIGLVKRVFIFSVITRALRGLRSWFSEAIKSNDEAAAAIARLKGALLTLAQPILNVVIPAFTALVNILAKVVSAIAAVFSALAGKSVKESAAAAESLYDEQQALKGVGGAAKDASKQLANFDEINKLEEDKGGGGGGGASNLAPDFTSVADELSPIFKSILADVTAIGAGLLAWRIARNFTSSLKTLAGIAMIVAGAIMLVYNWLDAWNNGIDWNNLIGMVAGLALVAGGLALVLGHVAAGIALIVGGLALIVVGFKDAFENGLNWQNTLTIIAGLIAAGLGIAILTGSWIPLLIAGIGSALVALVQLTEHGEELIAGLKNVVAGFGKFFKGVFTGDMELAAEGLKQIWEGLQQAWHAIVESVKDAWSMFVEWFNEKTDGKFAEILARLGENFKTVFGGIEEIIDGFKDFFAGFVNGDMEQLGQGLEKIINGVFNVAKGVIDAVVNIIDVFLGLLDQWTGGRLSGIIETIKNLFRGVGDAIKQILDGVITFITGVFSGDWQKAWDGVKGIFTGIWNGIITVLETAINIVVKGINWMLSKINTLSFDVPDWVPEIGGKTVGFNISMIPEASIPRLAAGAVIPPNREFLAVLGDQKSGTNIEAPMETIVAAFRQALNEGNGGDRTLVMKIGEYEFGRLVFNAFNTENTRIGISSVR